MLLVFSTFTIFTGKTLRLTILYMFVCEYLSLAEVHIKYNVLKCLWITKRFIFQMSKEIFNKYSVECLAMLKASTLLLWNEINFACDFYRCLLSARVMTQKRKGLNIPLPYTNPCDTFKHLHWKEPFTYIT